MTENLLVDEGDGSLIYLGFNIAPSNQLLRSYGIHMQQSAHAKTKTQISCAVQLPALLFLPLLYKSVISSL